MFTVEVQYFIRRHVYDFSMVSALLSLWVQRSLFIYLFLNCSCYPFIVFNVFWKYYGVYDLMTYLLLQDVSPLHRFARTLKVH